MSWWKRSFSFRYPTGSGTGAGRRSSSLGPLRALAVAGFVDALGGEPGGEALKDFADAERVDQLRARHAADRGAAIGLDLDQPVRRQPPQRFAQRPAADLEVARQLGLDQPLPGCEMPFENAVPDRISIAYSTTVRLASRLGPSTFCMAALNARGSSITSLRRGRRPKRS